MAGASRRCQPHVPQLDGRGGDRFTVADDRNCSYSHLSAEGPSTRAAAKAIPIHIPYWVIKLWGRSKPGLPSGKRIATRIGRRFEGVQVAFSFYVDGAQDWPRLCGPCTSVCGGAERRFDDRAGGQDKAPQPGWAEVLLVEAVLGGLTRWRGPRRRPTQPRRPRDRPRPAIRPGTAHAAPVSAVTVPARCPSHRVVLMDHAGMIPLVQLPLIQLPLGARRPGRRHAKATAPAQVVSPRPRPLARPASESYP